MLIDDTLLTHLEKLSMLKIAPDERVEMERHLTDILGFVEKLNELDTANIDEANAHEHTARLRADIPVEESDVIDFILTHAPQKSEHSFVVPRVVG